MSHQPDISRHSDYFAARAVEERRLAMSSKDPIVRAVHLEMAGRYAELANAGASATVAPQVMRERQQAG